MTLEDVMRKLEQIERFIVNQARATKSYFTIAEAAEMMDKSEYTVRDYCKKGELQAEKSNLLSGLHQQWRIAYDEILRFMREGKRKPLLA